MRGTAARLLSRPLLLFGGSGQVGRELGRTLGALGSVIAPSHCDADLARPETLRDTIRRVRPAAVVNAAALTNVDQAERDPGLAHAVNAVAPGVMAEEARTCGAVLVHYSTDYVFDGTSREPYAEDSPSNPINAYGQSKLRGEELVTAAGGSHVIIRTSWVYSRNGAGFVATFLRQLREGGDIRVVADQVGSPTWSRSLAAATTRLLTAVASDGELVLAEPDWGVYHLGGSGAASRLEIAKELVDATRSSLGGKPPRITAIPASEFGAAARRPAFSALANLRAERRFKITLNDWRTDLRRMLVED